MKFKATLTDLSTLELIFQALSKLGNSCLINLTVDTIHFLMNDEFTSGEQVFVNYPSRSLFSDYRIESKSNNTICFQVLFSNFITALKSANPKSNIIIKLTKKRGFPYLQLDIYNNISNNFLLVQEVPVLLVDSYRLSRAQEPDITTEPKVKIILTDLLIASLQNVADKLFKLHYNTSKELEIKIIKNNNNNNSSGEMSLGIRTDQVVCRTIYKDLQLVLPVTDNTDSDSNTSSQHNANTSELKDYNYVSDDELNNSNNETNNKKNICCNALIDIKKFTRVLHCSVLNPVKSIACIVERCAFVLHVAIGANDVGTITYYIPLIVEA